MNNEPPKPPPVDERMAQILADKANWRNCPVKTCGYFYKQSVIPECPACKHRWAHTPGYTQPPYEPPTLD